MLTNKSPLAHVGLLTLTARPGDSILIGAVDDIQVEFIVSEVRGNQVRVAVRTKEKDTPIYRDVVYERALNERKAGIQYVRRARVVNS